MSTRVLIAGVSTRAAAESAARAGFDVTAIDAFADLDQHPAVRAHTVPGSFTARAAVDAVHGIDCDAVAYLSTFENHPDAVRVLSTNRRLWGNPADVLKRVRDPIGVAEALSRRGFVVPKVRLKADAPTEERASEGPSGFRQLQYGASGFSRTEEWLIKPIASGGGHGIHFWRPGNTMPRDTYLQEFVDGVPGSIVFVAAAGRAAPVGIFQQLIGDRAFGADGFRYCGNILAPASDIAFGQDEDLVAAACRLAGTVAEAFDLVGVNGIDFVARAGIPHVVEINPRWCASMELAERAYGFSMFHAHARACDAGFLPDFDFTRARHAARTAIGKAVVFARRDITVDTAHAWKPDTVDDVPRDVRDIPRRGTRIPAGRPICTVFAEGSTTAACYSALVARADRVYADLDR